SYGFLQGFRPASQSGDYVYRYDPASDRLDVVADSFDKPNGLAFSPDGSVLYVGDSGANHEPGSYDPARPHHTIASDVVGGRLEVVGPSGELLALRRTEGAQIASSRVAVDKARTAAIFVRPSRELEEQVSSGRLGALALHGAAALTGGVPLVVDGEVVGAIG